MARPVNYDFERRERQKAKDAKKAAKAQAKLDSKQPDPVDGAQANPPVDRAAEVDAAVARDRLQND